MSVCRNLVHTNHHVSGAEHTEDIEEDSRCAEAGSPARTGLEIQSVAPDQLREARCLFEIIPKIPS